MTRPPTKQSWFPQSYSESFSLWWNLNIEVAENKVLSFVKLPKDYMPAVSQVVLSGKNRTINEYSITPPHNPEKALVVLHGYGAGLGLFYRNFEGLATMQDYRLYALDWLGMGRSSRPLFRIRAKSAQERIDETVSFFVEALEEWRVSRNIDKFALVAHSLGGYLGVEYALRYPERIENLVLVSPAGVGDSSPRSEINALQTEITESQSAQKVHPPVTKVPTWVTFLWNQNISPFSFIRFAGPLGARLVSGWSHRRFSTLPKEEQDALHTYAYSIFKGKGSGEYALAYLLAPGAHARRPLVHRVKHLKCPTTFIYGDRDWMDEKAGRKASELLRELGIESGVHVVEDAGHHVYLDNPPSFNALVRQILNQ